MNKLTNSPTPRRLEGIIVEVTGGSVTIDIAGRMGQLKIPLRMLICDEPPAVGQIVDFLISYPKVITQKNSLSTSSSDLYCIK